MQLSCSDKIVAMKKKLLNPKGGETRDIHDRHFHTIGIFYILTIVIVMESPEKSPY